MGGKNSAKSINTYMDKTYDRITILVPKGEKEAIKAHAEKNGESVNAFVNRAISLLRNAEQTTDEVEEAGAEE